MIKKEEKMKKNAFTLAEVLITLSVLGVVAALSIPNMIQQYQKRLTITKLQKAYANLEIAANNIAINSGCIGQTVKCTGLLDLADKFVSGGGDKPYEMLERFQQLSGFEGKITGSYSASYIPYLYCEKQNCSQSPTDAIVKYYTLNSKDGIGYSVRTSQWNHGNINDPKPLGIYVFTDTKNNAKLILGRNVFLFLIYDNFQVEPGVFCRSCGSTMNPMSKAANSTDIDDNCNVTTKSSGISCAARIIRDGWKMNY